MVAVAQVHWVGNQRPKANGKFPLQPLVKPGFQPFWDWGLPACYRPFWTCSFFLFRLPRYFSLPVLSVSGFPCCYSRLVHV